MRPALKRSVGVEESTRKQHHEWTSGHFAFLWLRSLLVTHRIRCMSSHLSRTIRSSNHTVHPPRLSLSLLTLQDTLPLTEPYLPMIV